MSAAKPAVDGAIDAGRTSAEFERAAKNMRAPWEHGDWDAAASDAPPTAPVSAALRSDPPSQVIRLNAPQVISDRPKASERVAEFGAAHSWSNAPPPGGAFGQPQASTFGQPVLSSPMSTFSSTPPISGGESQHDYFAASKSPSRNYALYGGVGIASLVGLALIWALFFRASGASTESAAAHEPTPSVKPPDEQEAAAAVAPLPTLPRHHLTIHANNGARVTVDGNETASLDNIELADGAHTVEISAEGFVSETRRVNLIRDTALTVNLRPTQPSPRAQVRRQRAQRRRPATSIRRSGFVSRNPY